jgi:short-subunit dehydrogenase involved in D-alanine esterification of teichoic acids
MTTNYLSPVHSAVHFLPHLIALAPRPAAIMLVSSGLSLVPLPRCPNYCASKAATRSMAWTMRAQLAGAPHSQHVRVIEIVPGAVQTELHVLQPDLAKAGLAHIGANLDEYTDETWAALVREDGPDEIMHSALTRWAHADEAKKKAFEALVEGMRKKGTSVAD